MYPNYGGGFARPNLTYDEYEALAPEEKWKAHPSVSLKAFFDREFSRLKRLVYMPVPCRRRKPSFCFRAQSPAEEAALLVLEDEFDADHEADDDYFENESDDEQDETNMKDLQLSDDEDQDEDEADDDISYDEIEWLRHDAKEAEYHPAPRLDSAELRPLPEKTRVSTP